VAATAGTGGLNEGKGRERRDASPKRPRLVDTGELATDLIPLLLPVERFREISEQTVVVHDEGCSEKNNGRETVSR
jgi:hypothetical protein